MVVDEAIVFNFNRQATLDTIHHHERATACCILDSCSISGQDRSKVDVPIILLLVYLSHEFGDQSLVESFCQPICLRMRMICASYLSFDSKFLAHPDSGSRHNDNVFQFISGVKIFPDWSNEIN